MDAKDIPVNIQRTALQWVRANRKKLNVTFCDPLDYKDEPYPSTTFMAGTPGAGKTEFSKSLVGTFDHHIVRIDADEIREMMREIGYNGKNASLFQRAVGAAVNNMYGYVLKKRQSVVIDGTFAYGNWRENIERSLQNNRLVEIYYLYQEPEVAWNFVKQREQKQGRVVPGDVFIHDYYASIENVTKAKEVFGEKLQIYFAKHNYKKEVEYVIVNIKKVEEHLPKMYTKEELREIIIHA